MITETHLLQHTPQLPWATSYWGCDWLSLLVRSSHWGSWLWLSKSGNKNGNGILIPKNNSDYLTFLITIQIDNGDPHLTNGFENSVQFVPYGPENDDISMPTLTTLTLDAQEVFPQEEVITVMPPSPVINITVGEVSTEVTASSSPVLTTTIPPMDEMTTEVSWASTHDTAIPTFDISHQPIPSLTATSMHFHQTFDPNRLFNIPISSTPMTLIPFMQKPNITDNMTLPTFSMERRTTSSTSTTDLSSDNTFDPDRLHQIPALSTPMSIIPYMRKPEILTNTPPTTLLPYKFTSVTTDTVGDFMTHNTTHQNVSIPMTPTMLYPHIYPTVTTTQMAMPARITDGRIITSSKLASHFSLCIILMGTFLKCKYFNIGCNCDAYL